MFHKSFLILILILGASIRLYDLSHFPTSLNWDEASHGYNAYSLLKTGNDEWGIPHPSIFRAFGDYKLPVYIYSLVPLVYLFGLNAFSVRFLSVIAGTSSILATYYLVQQLFAKDDHKSLISLLAAFFVAFSPWNIFVSRIAVEANLASALVVWGGASFIRGVNQVRLRQKPYYLMISSLLLGLSMFTYNSARVFAPLIFLTLVIIYWKYWGLRISLPFKLPYLTAWLSKLNRRVIIPACSCHLPAFALMLLFIFLTLYQSLYTLGGNARFTNISILDQGAINHINEARSASSLPSILARARYNKVNYFLSLSAQNYLSYFNPIFWFYRGGTHYQFSIPNSALLPGVLAPLILLGLISVIRSKPIIKYIIISWLLLAPIPASPTRDNPHVLRVLILTPIPQILAAIGTNYLLNLLLLIQNKNSLILRSQFSLFRNKLIITSIIICLTFLQTLFFWHAYTTTYAHEYSWAWQPGSQQLVSKIKQQYSNYDQIFVTKKYGEPHIFFAFYWPWDPLDYQTTKIWEYRDANTSNAWYWVNQLGKIKFINDWEMANLVCPQGQKCLRVDAQTISDSNWIQNDQISDYNHHSVFVLSESKI